jgi:hypothetical protein
MKTMVFEMLDRKKERTVIPEGWVTKPTLQMPKFTALSFLAIGHGRGTQEGSSNLSELKRQSWDYGENKAARRLEWHYYP